MNIIDQWKTSLQIFRPASFKLFLLVVANKIKEAFSLLTSSLWPFGLVVAVSGFAIGFFEAMVNFSIEFRDFSWSSVLFALFLVSILFVYFSFLVLIFRPSVKLKDMNYVHSYISHIGYIIIPGSLVFAFIAGLTYKVHVGWLFMPWFIGFCFIFFQLLSGSWLSRFITASVTSAKIILTQLPFVAISSLVFFGVLGLLSIIYTFLPDTFSWFMHGVTYLLFTVLLVAYFVTFFVKVIHEQYDLYFPKQEVR